MGRSQRKANDCSGIWHRGQVSLTALKLPPVHSHHVMSNICWAIIPLSRSFLPLISIICCWADFTGTVSFWSLWRKEICTVWPIRMQAGLSKTMGLANKHFHSSKTEICPEQNYWPYQTTLYAKKKVTTNCQVLPQCWQILDYDPIWKWQKEFSFSNHLGSKWNLYLSLPDSEVNILCAIWYYLVSETINYIAGRTDADRKSVV